MAFTTQDLEVFVALGPSRYTFQAQLSGAPFRLEELDEKPAQLAWSQVTAGEGGVQAASAQVVDGTAISDLGLLQLRSHGAAEFRWSLDQDRPVPFTPGLRILVPPAGGS